MPNIAGLKDALLNELWLPAVQELDKTLFPRSKKNRGMKLLTLTSDAGYQEIAVLEGNNLTKKDCVIAWTHSHIKKLRLETEISPATVIGARRYEDSISSSSFSITGGFPFHVINLDFSSQEPVFEAERVEREIKSVEDTIKLQKHTGGEHFVLLYTTLLNSNHLNYGYVVQISNSKPFPGGSGLSLTDFPCTVTDQTQKIRCIETVLSKVCSKYGYDNSISTKHIPLEKVGKLICSVVALV